MKVLKVDHVGIAVKSIEEALPVFKKIFGKDPEEIKELPDHGVKVAMFKIGETLIELLEPLGESSPIWKFVNERGGGLHHIAIGVKGLREGLKELEESGIRLIDKEPRIGAEGKEIAFIHPKSTFRVLLELVEEGEE